MKLRSKILGLIVLLASLDGGALTLGRIRGAAVVGQSLDVSIPLQLDSDENAASLCLEADVFHADTRQDPARVRVSVEPGQQPQTANVRVVSSAFIDEPMVTVYVKAGCSQKSTRRYVLLADYPSEAAQAPVSLPLAADPSGQAAPQSAGGSGAPVTGAVASQSAATGFGTALTAIKPAARVPAQRPTSAAKPPKPAALLKLPATEKAPVQEKLAAPVKEAVKEAAAPKTPATPAAPVVEKAVADPNAGQSRLKLDPLVVLADRVASLESSTSLPPVDVVRDSARVQTLEDSVKALVALAAKNEASLLEMRTRLQKAESERVPMSWMYVLAALLLACAAGMAYFWNRARDSVAAPPKDDWWSGSRGAPLAPSVASRGSEAAANESAPSRLISQRAGLPSGFTAPIASLDNPPSEVDVSLVEMSESNFDNLMQSGKSHSALRRGPLSPPVPNAPTVVQPMEQARVINSDELFDIRQQAEFFVSLGQTDQAVRILENQINDSGETSPLVYLDLLKIFHSMNLKTDFRQFREDFNLLYNGRVPEFSEFKNEGRDLESYPHVLAHITALWNTPKVLMVIEGSIFRDPLDEKSAPFELGAFRDLLLLYGVAQSTADHSAPVSDLAPLIVAPLSTVDASPKSAGDRSGAAKTARPAREQREPGGQREALNTQGGFSQVSNDLSAAHIDLDLDLTDLVNPSTASEMQGIGQVDLPLLVPDVQLPDTDPNLISFDLPEVPVKAPVPFPKARR